MATERARTFLGTTPEGQRVMVTIFEEIEQIQTLEVQSEVPKIVGMEVAFREGEDRWGRWSPPVQMTEAAC